LKYSTLLIVVMILLGCSKEIKLNVKMGPDEAFKKALTMYENKKYNNSVFLFQRFFNNYQGSKYTDDAQYYLAMSYFKMHNYRNALDEFSFLVNNFPESPFAESGYFRKAQCLEHISPSSPYDQEESMKAMDAYQEFITRYPYSKYVEDAKNGIMRLRRKIAVKNLNTARIYCKMRKYQPALIYVKKVIKETKDLDILDKAYIMMGDILKRDGRIQDAKNSYEKINNERMREKKLKGIK